MRAFRFALLCAGALAGTAAVAQAAPALLPHRAVYDLTMGEATERSGIHGISGRMVYEFAGTPCEGYTVKFRFVTKIDTDEDSRITDQRTTTFEDGDGQNFRFITKSYVGDTLEKEVKGTATAGPAGTTVTLESPEAEHLDLGKALFPTEHLLELIGKARAQDSFYQTKLFDGSDEADEIMMTTVIVGQSETIEGSDPEHDAVAPLSSQGYWPVTIAYFGGANDGGEDTPEYDISFKLHESGVTRDLVMNYGEFSIEGLLVDLAVFEAPDNCPE